jgi:hypothetical protein
MHGYIYIYLDMIYMVITLPKAGYDNNKLYEKTQEFRLKIGWSLRW